jgi:hypothetical protein
MEYSLEINHASFYEIGVHDPVVRNIMIYMFYIEQKLAVMKLSHDTCSYNVILMVRR